MSRALLSMLALLSLPARLTGQTELMTHAYEQERRSDFNGAAEAYLQVLRQYPGNLSALLGLERAGAVDQPATGLRQTRRRLEQPCLEGDELVAVLRRFRPGDVGVAADGPGGAAGRVEQHGVEGLRLPLRRIDGDDVGRQAEPLEIGAQTAQARS